MLLWQELAILRIFIFVCFSFSQKTAQFFDNSTENTNLCLTLFKKKLDLLNPGTTIDIEFINFFHVQWNSDISSFGMDTERRFKQVISS